jgi:hypothetical protein
MGHETSKECSCSRPVSVTYSNTTSYFNGLSLGKVGEGSTFYQNTPVTRGFCFGARDQIQGLRRANPDHTITIHSLSQLLIEV